MSHLPERSDKVCLNCGADLMGRYCHSCGQENIEPKESFWHLTVHFFEDLTHFDGKFFSTIKYLLFKPGYLTEEYIKGRRASYINPIRMYLFISAAFFLIYISFFISHSSIIKETRTTATDTSTVRRSFRELRLHVDSVETASVIATDTVKDKTSAQTVREYDSLQKALPPNERDRGIERYFNRKLVALNQFTREHPGELRHRFDEKFFHSLPYMLFISVPLIALLLWILYIRRRKQYYYVSHVIFILHFYCTVFLLLLIYLPVKLLPGEWSYLRLIPIFALVIYLYKAMRCFYKQRRAKTIFKFLVFGFFGSFLVGILAVIFMLKSLAAIVS